RAAGDLAPRQAEQWRASGAGAAQAPVVRGGAGAVRAVRQIGRHGRGRVVRTRLDQQHAAGRVLAQPGRQYTPGAARADDHDVISAAHGRDPDPRTMKTLASLPSPASMTASPSPFTWCQMADSCTLARRAHGG